MARRGLSARTTSLTVIRAVSVAASLLFAGVYGALLLSGLPVSLAVIHGATIVLIALSVSSWMVAPTAAAAIISPLTVVLLAWAWVKLRESVLACEAVAGVVLMGVAGVQQHRRTHRLHRLKQTLDDLAEEWYLKDQALQLTRQTHEALQRKLARYQQLQTIAEQLIRLVNLEAIAQLAVDQLFELIGKSDACLLFLVDRERQDLALFASKKAPTLPVVRTKHGDQFDRYALRTQRPLLVNDVRRDFRFSVSGESERPIGSVIACPLLVGENAEGVLRLDSTQSGVYTQDDLRFLDILLGLVDTAIANARLFAQTQRLAMTDGLTGLYRRQPFLDQLTREVARAARNGEPLAVLMLDLDNFKSYNDTFGHTAGDLVLKTVADLIRASVPPEGICGRYGGEEFAVLLPKTSLKDGAEIAGRIREAVERQAQTAGHGAGQFVASSSIDRLIAPLANPAKGGKAGQTQRSRDREETAPGGLTRGGGVTVSLGVSVFPEDAQAELELIRLADQRLYRAKRAGKNRVCAS